jgi:rod shape determining protein RodA
MLSVACLDFDHILHKLKLAKFIYLAGIAGMVLTLVLGEGEGGRDSWLALINLQRFGVTLNLQVSEIVKILYIVCFAKQLDSIRENPNRPRNIAFLALYAGILVGLVVLDNLGSALVYMFVTLIMCIAAGVSIWYIFAAGAVTAAAAPFLWNLLAEYQRLRIMYGFRPEDDPLGIGFQSLRSREMIGSGGVFGMGFQNGHMTQNGLLPAQRTDFIFATAGEELGFVGCLLVLLLLTVIIIRIFHNSFRARTNLGSLMCVGVYAMFMAQTMENIGMALAILPVVGITLPFFSYGGSSLLSCFMGIGLVLSVYSRRNIYYFDRDEELSNDDNE